MFLNSTKNAFTSSHKTGISLRIGNIVVGNKQILIKRIPEFDSVAVLSKLFILVINICKNYLRRSSNYFF